MYELLTLVTAEFLGTLIRTVTGRLYTPEQIQAITSGALGKYFAAFLPTPKEDSDAQHRVEAARQHIIAAGSIIREMQANLEAQDQKLGALIRDVEQKKQLADRYQALAETNREAFQAIRTEMELALRKELQEQAEKGRRIRQVVSLFAWVFTLLAGAAVGAYFKDLVVWIQGVWLTHP
jgi:vacuolar-type H+-ATPase subunit I/STV1